MIMDDEKIREWAALNLSLILEEDRNNLLNYIGQKEIDIFRESFFLIGDSFSERLARRLTQSILGNMSFEKRWRVTGFLKSARNVFLRRPLKPSLCSGTKMILDIAKKANTSLRTWRGKRAVVCLTHDVDTSQGYDFVPSLVEIEKRYYIRSTFNFLTGSEYNISEDLFLFLKTNGFEVGLHGAAHDAALAYRGEEKIEETILRALEHGGFCKFGFRSPSLSMSTELIRVLGKCKVRYDSSVSMYYKGWGSCFPYFFPEAGVWELPLCLQDDVLFRDLKLTQNEAFNMTKEFIEDVKEIGGVCVLNFHPVLVKSNLAFYRKVMAFLASQSDFWIATGNELIDLIEQTIKEKELM